MDKKIVDIIKNNEQIIQSTLLRGIDLNKVEEELSNILFHGKTGINVCNDNKALYFIAGNMLYIYSEKTLCDGFISELINNYSYQCISTLTFGVIRKIQLDSGLKSRLNLPKILLINLHMIEKYPSYRMALGIADIAGYLRKYNLAKVDIIDMQFCGIKDVYKRIDEALYNYIGLSANFGHLDLVNELIDYIENSCSNAQILVGNYLAATEYDSLLKKYKNILICSNEGELTFARLCLNHIKEKNTLSNIPNLYYFDGKTVRFTYLEFIEMDDLPFPAIDTIEMLFLNEGVMTLEYSRGCNYGKCSFCPRKFKGLKWRGMSFEKMFGLWQYYYLIFSKYKRKAYVYFADEEFLGNCQEEENYCRIKNLFDKIDAENMQMNFDISCRVDQLVNGTRTLMWTVQQVDLFKLAKKAGLKRIFLGLESGAKEQIKRYNKGIDISQAVVSLRLFSMMGFKLRLGFITFDPLMTKKDLLDNIEMLARGDIILPPSEISTEAIINILSDNISVLKPYEYLYEAISYLASPLELLRDCSYVENLKRNHNYLAENMENIDNFGRFQCGYLDKEIKEICDYCQKWINYNFPLIYTIKGLAKRHDYNEEKYNYLILNYRKSTFYFFVTLCAIKNVIDINTMVGIIGVDISKFVINAERELISFENAMAFYECWFKEKIDKTIGELLDCIEEQNMLCVVYGEWKKKNALNTPVIREV